MHPAAIGSSGGGSGRERPRFRQDLVAELIEAPGARFIDVMAPDSGNLYRFYEVEYSLACGMDGERDVAGIVRWAQDELGLTPSQQEVRAVIATLGDLGFIDAEAEAPVTELAAGVVVSPPARPQPSPGLELGGAGGGAPAGAPLPPAPDMMLGAAGTQRSTRPTPAPPTDVVLGAPGARSARPTPSAPLGSAEASAAAAFEAASEGSSEVSIDLSDHIAVRPDDVKEAVRASRVMSVDVPQDLLDSLDEPPTSKSAILEQAFAQTESGRRSDPGWAPEVGRSSDPARVHDTRPEIRVGKSPPSRQAPNRPPVELPPAPALGPVDKPLLPPATGKGVSPVLIVLLVLAVLGAGAFLVWKKLLQKPATDADVSTSPTPPPVKPAPPPPPPPAPAAKIALETPSPDDVKLTRAGVVENILADKTVVKEGDIIMRLVGDKPIEAELGALGRDQKRLKDLIEAATKRRDAASAAGNKAAEAAATTEIGDRQKTLAVKEGLLAKKTSDLDNFLIHAPASGVFSPGVKPGQKVAADAVVAKVQRDAIPTAIFKVANTRPFAANASVEVAIGKGEQRATCTIADVQPDGVKVTCPAEPALTDGVDVTLNAPLTTSPEAPAPPTLAPTGTPPSSETLSPLPGSAGAPGPGSSAGSSAP